MHAMSLPLAFSLNALLPRHHHPRLVQRRVPRIVSGNMGVAQTGEQQTIVRRSANYQPPIWKYEHLQSLNSKYKGLVYEKQLAQLKQKVRKMIENAQEPLERLEFIDALERLGVSYHFEAEIATILKNIYGDHVDHRNTLIQTGDVHAMALEFRLLRQHGYMVTQDIFTKFKDESGNFNESLSTDIKGLLSLYEASFLLMDGENLLEEAKEFTTKLLKLNLNKDSCESNSYISMLVSHSLELPLHWRMPRMEARWFIDAYEKNPDMNTTLLSFAKLDYNMLQAIHQQDLQQVSRWWESTGWREKLPFTRDRVVENYLWSLGEAFEPKYQAYRDFETRINITTTCVDDVYDIYGTLEELELFTNAVSRWDVNELEKLPEYMRICFNGLFNLINELAYFTLKEHGINILPYLRHKWQDLLGYYMMEARWARDEYIPTLDEYLNYAWVSASPPELLTHAFFLSKDPMANPITKEELDAIENYHDMIKWPSLVARLADDLGTSPHEVKRGDTAKSIQIYMHETGASAEEAREHVKYLISEGWKKINKARLSNCPFNQSFIEITTNLARVSQFMYEHGDGHGHDVGGKNKERVNLLLIEPIPLTSEDLSL